VDDLEVDDELTATVVDDEGTDGATAVGEGIADALEEAALGDDGEALLDITSLGHGDNLAVITEVEDAVGLVDGAEHGLDDHGGRGVRDEARLLLQLAGEQVDTEVAVLASLGGDGDADHLAGTALQDEDVTDADKVAGDGDGLAGNTAVAGLHNADLLTDTLAEAGRATLIHDDLLAVVVVEGVEDTLGSALNAAAEGVVVTLVVVVAHLARCGSYVTDSGSLDLDVGLGGRVVRGRRLLELDLAAGILGALVGGSGLRLVTAVVRDVDGVGRLVVGGGGRLLVATVVRDVDFVSGRGPATVLSLSDVELGLDGLVVNLGTFLEADRGLAVVGVAFTGQLNLSSVVARFVGLVARSVVGSSSTIVTLDAEIDFFLSVDTRVGERGGDSSIFPFDVRSAIELDFSLYSRLSSFRDSVTPVRRREDTEGDGDAGVKVQID